MFSVHRFVVPPELAAIHFSEKLIYLPLTYQANKMPISLPMCGDKGQCRRQLKIVDDVDDEHTLFCSFNSNKKMEPIAWTAWMNILLRVPKSVLLLLYEGSSHTKLATEAALRGVRPHRLRFLGSVSIYLMAIVVRRTDNFIEFCLVAALECSPYPGGRL
jgi:protein O-GlcNAc transferase